tara:strand:- start:26 stop:358 length:333 start_codon:yes stop_codon:yes gene_type:complete
MPKKKQPYHPNNWERYNKSPSHWFDSIPYDDFMDWKIGGWEIPSSVTCIIRENTKDGKVKEHVYQTIGHAKNKIGDLMVEGTSEFTVCDHESVQIFRPPTPEELYDDPLA